MRNFNIAAIVLVLFFLATPVFSTQTRGESTHQEAASALWIEFVDSLIQWFTPHTANSETTTDSPGDGPEIPAQNHEGEEQQDESDFGPVVDPYGNPAP